MQMITITIGWPLSCYQHDALHEYRSTPPDRPSVPALLNSFPLQQRLGFPEGGKHYTFNKAKIPILTMISIPCMISPAAL